MLCGKKRISHKDICIFEGNAVCIDLSIKLDIAVHIINHMYNESDPVSKLFYDNIFTIWYKKSTHYTFAPA